MYGYGYGMGAPGVGVDVDGDGIADFRTGPGLMGPGVVGAPMVGVPMVGAPMVGGYGMGMMSPGVGIDVNGDGIADVRTGPYGVTPGPGMYMGYGGLY